MNYIAQLLPSQRAVKSEHSHKDKKQKNEFIAADEVLDQEDNSQPEPLPAVMAKLTENLGDNLTEVSPEERRSGDERRVKNITRGRWLDSRDKQERRKPIDIYVKI